MTDSLPNINDLWNFNDPAATEQRFRELLPIAEESGERSYYLQLLTQIARTHSLRAQYEEAHETLNQVEPHVASAPLVEVRYLLERGRTFNSAKQRETALPLFIRAWECAQAANLDGLAVDAAHMVAIAEADSEQKLAWNLKALDYAEQSSRAAAKKWLGSLYNNIGWTYHDMGDYNQALALFEKQLTWQHEHGSTEMIRIARWTVGRALRSLKRLEEALRLQQDLLAEYEAANEPATFTYEEIAECLLSLGREAEAKPYFAKAYEQLSEISWVEPERLERLKKLGEA